MMGRARTWTAGHFSIKQIVRIYFYLVPIILQELLDPTFPNLALAFPHDWLCPVWAPIARTRTMGLLWHITIVSGWGLDGRQFKSWSGPCSNFRQPLTLGCYKNIFPARNKASSWLFFARPHNKTTIFWNPKAFHEKSGWSRGLHTGWSGFDSRPGLTAI